MNCIATSLNANVGPWNNSNNFISPTFEVFTTSFSLNVEYDLLIKDKSSSLEIKSAENKFELNKAKKVFGYSILYLFLIFVLFLIDSLI